MTVRRVLLGVILLFVAAIAFLFPMRSKFTAQAADLSREWIGDENTARLESYYFRLEDRMNKVKYRIFGTDETPFAARVRVEFIPDPPRRVVTYHVPLIASGPTWSAPAVPPDLMNQPVLLRPPKTQLLRDDPLAGEGEWSTVGLPRTSPEDMLMARTFIRPDRSRPYATVGVLLVDSRRVRLHLRGGTADPGGDIGVPGPGVIPADEYKDLLVAWNGGFKGPHGGFGMYADGRSYRPLRNGLASLAVTADGKIALGEWGRDIAWSDDLVAVRQNAVLLVRDCEVSSRVTEGNDTWGYVNVNSAEFITWRSAVGLAKDGNLLVAAGNSLSAETLGKALWAAGACWAMQLDINTPYVLTSLFTQQPDGSLKAERFMEAMPDNPNRFLRSNERDFMYLTYDETNYLP